MVILRWWRLYKRVRPALGVFGDHVSYGRGYSPARLITVFSALEAYGRARHRTTDLAALRHYADVPSALIGCTNPALKLLGACRGYCAHLKPAGSKYTAAQLEDAVFDSTRRASALMQACVLRDLGFNAKRRIELLERHYKWWPLP